MDRPTVINEGPSPQVEKSDFGDLKARLRKSYVERRDGLGWLGKNGKLTKRGADEAMSWIVGVHVGLQEAGHGGIGVLVWLSSARTVEDVL